MINFKKGLAALAVIVAVGAAASPSYAQSQDGGVRISAQRAQALHTCSVRAARYPQYLWGNQELIPNTYRACMAEHGQPE
jgi:hypothetical protein